MNVSGTGTRLKVQKPQLDRTFHRGYILSMECEVEFTDEFESWWSGLNTEEQEDVDAMVLLLEQNGPALRRPHVGLIASSKHQNMQGTDCPTCRSALSSAFCI